MTMPDGPVERISAACGRVAAWLALACVILVFGLVVARYGFSRGSVAAQEAVLWLHSGVFLFGAAWALARDGHVRVDILRQGWDVRRQAWADLLGLLLFLLPFCLFSIWISLDYVAASWRVRESSRESGGLPAVYLLKTLIPVAFLLLAAQGAALAWRALAVVRTER